MSTYAPDPNSSASPVDRFIAGMDHPNDNAIRQDGSVSSKKTWVVSRSDGFLECVLYPWKALGWWDGKCNCGCGDIDIIPSNNNVILTDVVTGTLTTQLGTTDVSLAKTLVLDVSSMSSDPMDFKLRVGLENALTTYWLSSPYGFIYNTLGTSAWENYFYGSELPSIATFTRGDDGFWKQRSAALCVRRDGVDTTDKTLLCIYDRVGDKLFARVVPGSSCVFHATIAIQGMQSFKDQSKIVTLATLDVIGVDMAEKSMYVDSGLENGKFYLKQYPNYTNTHTIQCLDESTALSLTNTWERHQNCICTDPSKNTMQGGENLNTADHRLRIMFKRTCNNVIIRDHTIETLVLGLEYTRDQCLWWVRSDHRDTLCHEGSLYIPSTTDDKYVKFDANPDYVASGIAASVTSSIDIVRGQNDTVVLGDNAGNTEIVAVPQGSYANIPELLAQLSTRLSATLVLGPTKLGFEDPSADRVHFTYDPATRVEFAQSLLLDILGFDPGNSVTHTADAPDAYACECWKVAGYSNKLFVSTQTSAEKTVTIAPGSYTKDSLVTAINNGLDGLTDGVHVTEAPLTFSILDDGRAKFIATTANTNLNFQNPDALDILGFATQTFSFGSIGATYSPPMSPYDAFDIKEGNNTLTVNSTSVTIDTGVYKKERLLTVLNLAVVNYGVTFTAFDGDDELGKVRITFTNPSTVVGFTGSALGTTLGFDTDVVSVTTKAVAMRPPRVDAHMTYAVDGFKTTVVDAKDLPQPAVDDAQWTMSRTRRRRGLAGRVWSMCS